MLLNLPINVKGHVNISDDLGNVLLDQDNAVHPQNLARVISRALANEHNFSIYRIAYGNGGTSVDAAYTITYNPPNDGQSPDPNTWNSRLYNETYSEIVDAESVLLGTGPGANPAGDPPSVPYVSGPGVVSNELGLTSTVTITSVLNPGEPTGEFSTDQLAPTQNTETSFVFDEIGLFTSGGPPAATAGYQTVNVGNRLSTDNSGLVANTAYSFTITVNGGSAQVINFTTPVAGGSGPGGTILYGDLCQALNTGAVSWGLSGSPAIAGAAAAITDYSGSFASISGAQTFGFLRFTSGTSGTSSSISLADAGGLGIGLFAHLNPVAGGTIQAPIAGLAAGVQNNPVSYLTERERLLTHIVFSPVLKSANRTLTITYTLTVSVARTV